MSDSNAVVTTNGKTLKAFYADDDYWGDRHQDEVIFVVNGKEYNEGLEAEKLNDTDEVVIQYGYVIDPATDDAEDILKFFSRWQKQATTISWLVDVPQGQEAAVKAALESLGCRINCG
jgi:hypothetical protein